MFPAFTASFVFIIKLAIIPDAVEGSTASATFTVSLDILFNESSILLEKSSAVILNAALVPSNFCIPSKIAWSLLLLDLNLDANLSIHLSIAELLKAKSFPFCAIIFPVLPKP